MEDYISLVFSRAFFFNAFFQQPIKISARFYWHSGAIRSHAQQECSFIAKLQEAVCETNLCERVQILMGTIFFSLSSFFSPLISFPYFTDNFMLLSWSTVSIMGQVYPMDLKR